MSYAQQQNQEIVKSVSFSNLLNQRAAVVERLQAAKAAYDEAQALCHAMGIGSVPTSSARSYRNELLISGETYLQKVSSEIDAQLWNKLMNESGLRSFMNAKTRDEWQSQLHDGKEVPAFTSENVAATFQALYASRGDMFERGVIDWNRKGIAMDLFTASVLLQREDADGTTTTSHTLHWFVVPGMDDAIATAIRKAKQVKPLLDVVDVICSNTKTGEVKRVAFSDASESVY